MGRVWVPKEEGGEVPPPQAGMELYDSCVAAMSRPFATGVRAGLD
jgi:hypothetical protein